MRAELLELMFQHNRRAKRVAEGVELIRGGIGKDVPTESKRLEVEMEFHILDIWELPEAIEYVEESKAGVRDRWDAMLVPNPTPVKIPLGIWFPASTSNEFFETPAVYQIVKRIDEQRSRVKLACSNSAVQIQPGTKIMRRFNELNVHVATVTKII